MRLSSVKIEDDVISDGYLRYCKGLSLQRNNSLASKLKRRRGATGESSSCESFMSRLLPWTGMRQ